MQNTIIHGDVASANGSVPCEDGTSRSFCDVFSFDGYSGDARIESIDSFVIVAG